MVLALIAILTWRAELALRIATGSVSHALCAAAFVSGLDPDQVYREEQRPVAGMSSIAWALQYQIDPVHKDVRTTVAGLLGARAVYHDGFGCSLVHGNAEGLPDSAAAPAATEPSTALPLIEAIDPRLSAALDQAFAEPDARRLRQTKAIVVLHRGHVIAERYAPGITADTPLWGHSLTKSVTSALIGILVDQGRLKIDQPAPVAAWQAADDPRHAVTVDQLLRMTAGLPADETNAIVTPATRMWFLEADSAAFAARQPLVAKPATQWGYSNLSYALLSGLIRQAVGGDPAATRRFIQDELFSPLGLQHATLEFDAAGTPAGNGFMFASARDWARFGELYLEEGVANGRRILPVGWAQYSAKQSLESSGYGAGFWTNRKRDGEIPYWGIEWGLSSLPADSYFGRGALGQFIVIVPSEQLVVVRLGLSHDTSPGINILVASIIATLKASSETPR
jgi:CubicO group peptidase (beta-lactamase class C family)